VKITIAFISLVVMLALGVNAIGCTSEYVPEITEYSLTISATGGGDVTTPGEGVFAYCEGQVVSLIAEAESGYRFAKWAGDASTIADPDAAATTITMSDNYSITANFHETPAAYDFEEGGMSFPNPNPDIGTAIRGDIAERGYLFPSDLQRHSFFTGTT
jgi:hypothetical protein